MGFAVAKPWGDSDRYDFILDSGGRLWRVQLKSAYRGRKDGGYSIHAFGNENSRPYTPDEVDIIVAYIVPADAWYVIPIEVFTIIHGIRQFPRSRRRRSRHEIYREAWCIMACKPGGPRVRRKCVDGMCRLE
jgi:PD-(D/E)XK endonuclease